MSSFFGNISNDSRSQLVFDKVYPNRKRLEQDLKNDLDNIFVGRFAIVVYDDNATKRRPGYLKQGEGRRGNALIQLEYYKIYKDYECEYPYRLRGSDEEQGYGIFPNDIFAVEIGTEYYYFQCVSRKDVDDDIAWCKLITHITRNEDLTNYALNYLEDKNYFGTDFPSKGYDATIWKKAIRNGNAFFQMVGCLNSDSPTFSAEAGPPSAVPKSPTFGSLSTNKNMTLWYPSSWGFRLKPAEDGKPSDIVALPTYVVDENNEIILDNENPYNAAVYYNKDGFDTVYNRKDDETLTEVSITTGASGKIYRDEEGNAKEHPDFQELKMYLPEIGNAVADLWNVIYGKGEPIASGELKRNKDIQWNSTSGERMVTTDPDKGGYIFDSKVVETLAGSINSVHDLMGMIITEIPEGTNPNFALGDALENRIYYGDLHNTGQKNFYFKDKYYILKSFEEQGWDQEKIDSYVGGREYQNLIPFKRYKYYTYEDDNFYIDTDITFSDSTPYYRLGDPIKVNLLQWQPIDEETGEVIYYYYIDKNGDYIKDTSDTPDLDKIYYDIETKQITNGTNKLLWDGPQEIIYYDPEDEDEDNVAKYNELMSALIAAGYQEQSIQGVGSGFFFSKTDEEGNEIILPTSAGPDEFNSDYRYYHLNQIALIQMQSETGQDVNIYFIIDNEGQVVALSEYASLESYRVIFYDPNTENYYQAFSEERNGVLVEGYSSLKQDANGKWIIDNTKPYVIITSQEEITNPNPEVDPDTGEVIPTLFYTPGEFFTCLSEYETVKKDDVFKDYVYYFVLQEDGTYTSVTITAETYDSYNKETLFILLRDYYLSKSLIKDDEEIYYRLTKINKETTEELKRDENGEWDIDPISENFYQPNKYYYYDKKYGDTLDQSEVMRTVDDPNINPDFIKNGMIYYLINYAYVIYDESNTLNKGSRWDKGTTAPDGVILGSREESTQWTELPGFAKSLNTIHGLILNVNKMFRFDDPYIRDDESVQGMLNQIRDITRSFELLYPGDIVTVNSYGQLTGVVGLAEVILKNYTNADMQVNSNDITNEDTLMSALIKLENRIKVLENKLAT